jgi:4-hydroxybenzoyl-CoA thioesterase
MPFSRDILIRFQHCDPAGIVFYPRYFEMVNQVIEDWFAEALGMSFQQMHIELGLGVPAVHLECDFVKASRIGEVVRFDLSVKRLGTKSFELTVAGNLGGDLRLKVNVTLCCVQLGDNLVSMPIPPTLKSKMEGYLA